MFQLLERTNHQLSQNCSRMTMYENLSRLIISAEAGSLFAQVGDVVGAGLQKALSKSIAVDHVGTSSGVEGAKAGAASPADGSALLICNKGAVTSHPQTDPDYKTSDFAPLCQVAEAPIAVVVAADSPFMSLSDLFDAARAQPGTLSFCTPNPYHTQRLAMAGFCRDNNIDFKFVVMPGNNADNIRYLTEKKVDFAFLAAHNLVEDVRGGKLRILGVAHAARLPFLPGAPTFKEQGYELETAIWLGLFARSGTQPSTLDGLAKLGERVANDSAVGKAIADLKMVPTFIARKDFETKVARDTDYHRGVLELLGAL
jgi:tripartite-type tricarboxylate transporter receptor subunit TctC